MTDFERYLSLQCTMWSGAGMSKESKEEMILLKKGVENDLSKIEEYKRCKQYWYDKYMELLK